MLQDKVELFGKSQNNWFITLSPISENIKCLYSAQKQELITNIILEQNKKRLNLVYSKNTFIDWAVKEQIAVVFEGQPNNLKELAKSNQISDINNKTAAQIILAIYLKLKEKTIENGLAKYYRAVAGYDVKNQVWLSQKRIDIVLIEQNTKEILAIEVKIYDWKTAIRQANLNKIACHKSYVAIWHEFSHRALQQRDTFEDLGIGLIVIEQGYQPRIEIQPKESYYNSLACNYILSTV